MTRARNLAQRLRKPRIVLLSLACALTLSACGSESFEQIPDFDALDTAPSLMEPAAPGNREVGDTGSEVRSDVITVGSATVTIDDPVAAASGFTAAVEEKGGRTSYSETSTHLDRPRATVEVRVPAERYQEVVSSLSDFGEVVSQSTRATDVGQERVDLEARRQALQTSVDRLTELMSAAGSVEELLQAEENLTERQAELDSLDAQLAYLADQVALSTLDVTFTVDDEGIRPPNVFERAWRTFLDSLQMVLIVTVGLLPWLLILAAVVAVVLALVRRRRRHRGQ